MTARCKIIYQTIASDAELTSMSDGVDHHRVHYFIFQKDDNPFPDPIMLKPVDQ